jgi:hypothetical protein
LEPLYFQSLVNTAGFRKNTLLQQAWLKHDYSAVRHRMVRVLVIARWGFAFEAASFSTERIATYNENLRRNRSIQILCSIHNRKDLNTPAFGRDLEPRPGTICVNSFNSPKHLNRRLSSILVVRFREPPISCFASNAFKTLKPKRGRCIGFHETGFEHEAVANEFGAFRKDLPGRLSERHGVLRRDRVCCSTTPSLLVINRSWLSALSQTLYRTSLAKGQSTKPSSLWFTKDSTCSKKGVQYIS